MKMLNC